MRKIVRITLLMIPAVLLSVFFSCNNGTAPEKIFPLSGDTVQAAFRQFYSTGLTPDPEVNFKVMVSMQDDEVEYRYENSVDPDWIMKLHFQKNGNSYVYRNENILLIDSTASTINEKEIMVYKYDLKNNPEGTHLITIISREYGWMGYSIDPAGNGMVLNTFGGEKMDNKWMQLMTDKDTGFFRYRH